MTREAASPRYRARRDGRRATRRRAPRDAAGTQRRTLLATEGRVPRHTTPQLQEPRTCRDGDDEHGRFRCAAREDVVRERDGSPGGLPAVEGVQRRRQRTPKDRVLERPPLDVSRARQRGLRWEPEHKNGALHGMERGWLRVRWGRRVSDRAAADKATELGGEQATTDVHAIRRPHGARVAWGVCAATARGVGHRHGAGAALSPLSRLSRSRLALRCTGAARVSSPGATASKQGRASAAGEPLHLARAPLRTVSARAWRRKRRTIAAHPHRAAASSAGSRCRALEVPARGAVLSVRRVEKTRVFHGASLNKHAHSLQVTHRGHRNELAAEKNREIDE